MTPEEFRRLIKQSFDVKLTDEELRSVVAHFDRDKDGHIDYMEVKTRVMNPHRVTDALKDDEGKAYHFSEVLRGFRRWHCMLQPMCLIARWLPPVCTIQAMEKLQVMLLRENKGEAVDLRALYVEADIDKNGALDRAEFGALMRTHGMTQGEADVLFEVLDPNDDGEISFGEFAWTYYNRRLYAPKKAKGRLTKNWVPAGRTAITQAHVSEDRQHAYRNSQDFFPTETLVQWEKPPVLEFVRMYHMNDQMEGTAKRTAGLATAGTYQHGEMPTNPKTDTWVLATSPVKARQ
jgi:Ca2+-binding EF-hand superfamily protein